MKHINWDSVEATYVGTSCTLKEIAAAHGSSITTVHRHMKARGLARRAHRAEEDNATLQASRGFSEIAQIELLAASIDIAEVVRTAMEQMKLYRVSPAEAKAYLRNSLHDCLD